MNGIGNWEKWPADRAYLPLTKFCKSLFSRMLQDRPFERSGTMGKNVRWSGLALRPLRLCVSHLRIALARFASLALNDCGLRIEDSRLKIED
jgi:hypothetical protein